VEILLNWLWQGCAVTAAVWVALTLCRRLSATTRYQVWWATLVLVLILPALPSLVAAVLPARETGTGFAPLHAVMLLPLPLTTLVIVWAVWIGVMLWRTVRAFSRVRFLKQACVPFPADRQTRLAHWMSIHPIGRRVRLVVSDQVRCAAAIGLYSPVIAVAPAVLRELDDEELDRILVHEWAHIQRRDDIARLFQLFVNVLVGFNPAVWWIDRRIEIEREVACDDQVIEITGGRTAYAKSLLKLAAVPNRPVDLSLVSAVLSAPKLSTRILRLLDGRRNVSTRRSLVALTLAAPGLLVLALSVASMTPVTLAVEEQRPLPATESVSLAPPASTLAHDVALVDSRSEVFPSLPESETRRQRQLQSGAQPALVGFDSTVLISGAEESTTPRSVPAMPAVLNYVDDNVERNAPLAGLPVAIGMTPASPVPLAQQTVSQTTPMKSASGTPEAVESPWSAASNTGTALGRTSQQAATRTASFFTRLSKNIAGSF
jgi:beta-lactamase regulating signal transducer with metallopeptidase domain